MIATRTLVAQHVPGDAKARSRWAKAYASSSKFYYTRVRLLNAALPAETANIMANTTTKRATLIIDSNSRGMGKTGAFTPKCVVISGADVRRKALAKGESFAMAWVGENALRDMNVFASDGISSDELYQKLSAALTAKFKTKGDPYMESGAPWVCEVFPFDNYMIFNMAGQKFQQNFTIDTMARTVVLDGSPVKVEQEYVDVDSCSTMLQPFDRRGMAPFTPTGLRVNPTMVLPSLFTVSLGAVNSELRNPMFGEAFLNVDTVVSAYLSDIKDGGHKAVLPWGSPIVATRMIFAGELRNRGVDSPADFFAWVNANKDKKVSGDPTEAKDFAHVGDPKDKSTWKLPIRDKGHVRDAMSRFDQTDLPADDKAKAAKKIVRRAKKMGIDSKNFEKEYSIKTESVEAGGPGSGPRPGDGHSTNDAHDDGNHNVAKKAEVGYGDGQTDPYGYQHDHATRDAVVEAFKGKGYKEDNLDQAVQDRGLRSVTKDMGSKGLRNAMVHPDGSFTHSTGAYANDHGKGVDDVSRLVAAAATASPFAKRLLTK